MAAPFCLCVWCKLQIARRNTYFINARNIVALSTEDVSPYLSLSLIVSSSLSIYFVFVPLLREETRPD